MYLFTEFYNNSVFEWHDKYLIFNLILEKQKQRKLSIVLAFGNTQRCL